MCNPSPSPHCVTSRAAVSSYTFPVRPKFNSVGGDHAQFFIYRETLPGDLDPYVPPVPFHEEDALAIDLP